MRLINADDLNRRRFYKETGGKDTLITVETAFNIVDALPTIDAKPVVYGSWIEKIERNTNIFVTNATEVLT